MYLKWAPVYVALMFVIGSRRIWFPKVAGIGPIGEPRDPMMPSVPPKKRKFIVTVITNPGDQVYLTGGS